MKFTGCRPLLDEEYKAMFSAFTGKYSLRDRALFEFGVRTGFRISEILSVKIGDVFCDGRMRNSVTVQKNRMKGKKKSRSMPLHPLARDAMATWIKSAGFDHPEMGEHPLFCCQRTSKQLSRTQACDILKETAKRAGLNTERVASHTLRKTFATNMWHSPHVNGDVFKLAHLLGHENLNNCLRYVLFIDGSLDLAVMGD